MLGDARMKGTFFTGIPRRSCPRWICPGRVDLKAGEVLIRAGTSPGRPAFKSYDRLDWVLEGAKGKRSH
jgi:hypothetical protein